MAAVIVTKPDIPPPRAIGRRLRSLALEPSVPIPKFASLCGALACELRNQRDTSNL